MKFLVLMAMVLLLASAGLGYFAVTRFAETAAAKAKNDQIANENQRLEAELADLRSDAYSEPIQVKYSADALSEFYMRLIEAGEVLGAGVRIAPKGGGAEMPKFTTVKYGVMAAPVLVDAAAPISAAPALFAMLWDELYAMPVSINRISARPRGGVISLQLEIDIFGR